MLVMLPKTANELVGRLTPFGETAEPEILDASYRLVLQHAHHDAGVGVQGLVLPKLSGAAHSPG